MGRKETSPYTLPPSVAWLISGAGIVFFISGSLRHALFQSTAFDLGIFDQALYLISRGNSPTSSFLGLHLIGDHVSLILYPLALLYRISPDVHWLFAVQAAALALGAWPVWTLARTAGLEKNGAVTMALAYLLYPVVFNVSLFDFHPEAIALPVLLGAVVAARLSRPLWFVASVIVVLSCKAVLSLTVAAMGVWLLTSDSKSFPVSKRLRYAMALFSIIIGVAWFIIATQVAIPSFVVGEYSHVSRYGYLGATVSEIALNLIRKPGPVFGRIFSLDTATYLFLVCLPVLWGLSWRRLTPLIGAAPILLLNVLADYDRQRSLVFQYTLPVIPFLMLAVMAKGSRPYRFPWPSLQRPRLVVLWSLAVFLLFSQARTFVRYAGRLDTWRPTREAVALISPGGSVLTDNRLAPHLTHRPAIRLFHQVSADQDLSGEFDYVLLNLRHPWPDTREIGAAVAVNLRNNPRFHVRYERDQVVLFENVRLGKDSPVLPSGAGGFQTRPPFTG